MFRKDKSFDKVQEFTDLPCKALSVGRNRHLPKAVGAYISRRLEAYEYLSCLKPSSTSIHRNIGKTVPSPRLKRALLCSLNTVSTNTPDWFKPSLTESAYSRAWSEKFSGLLFKRVSNNKPMAEPVVSDLEFAESDFVTNENVKSFGSIEVLRQSSGQPMSWTLMARALHISK